MSEKITVPTLGESVTEATVSKWLKSQGEKVVVDEPIVELETDKVNVEVPAPSNGFLGTIDVKEGETVNVGSILGTINDSLKNNDTVEVADALGDMLYILCGTIITHGMQNIIDDVFDEIQKSNMSKLDNEGKPIYRDDGKVLKGPNYFKPNIRKFF